MTLRTKYKVKNIFFTLTAHIIHK